MNGAGMELNPKTGMSTADDTDFMDDRRVSLTAQFWTHPAGFASKFLFIRVIRVSTSIGVQLDANVTPELSGRPILRLALPGKPDVLDRKRKKSFRGISIIYFKHNPHTKLCRTYDKVSYWLGIGLQQNHVVASYLRHVISRLCNG
jgi:hypothetical protein